jgi:hypothetical protein
MVPLSCCLEEKIDLQRPDFSENVGIDFKESAN